MCQLLQERTELRAVSASNPDHLARGLSCSGNEKSSPKVNAVESVKVMENGNQHFHKSAVNLRNYPTFGSPKSKNIFLKTLPKIQN